MENALCHLVYYENQGLVHLLIELQIDSSKVTLKVYMNAGDAWTTKRLFYCWTLRPQLGPRKLEPWETPRGQFTEDLGGENLRDDGRELLSGRKAVAVGRVVPARPSRREEALQRAVHAGGFTAALQNAPHDVLVAQELQGPGAILESDVVLTGHRRRRWLPGGLGGKVDLEGAAVGSEKVLPRETDRGFDARIHFWRRKLEKIGQKWDRGKLVEAGEKLFWSLASFFIGRRSTDLWTPLFESCSHIGN